MAFNQARTVNGYSLHKGKKNKFLVSGRKRQTVNCRFHRETARKRKSFSVKFLIVLLRFFAVFLCENCNHDLGIKTLLFSPIKIGLRSLMSWRFVEKSRLLEHEIRTTNRSFRREKCHMIAEKNEKRLFSLRGLYMSSVT